MKHIFDPLIGQTRQKTPRREFPGPLGATSPKEKKVEPDPLDFRFPQPFRLL